MVIEWPRQLWQAARGLALIWLLALAGPVQGAATRPPNLIFILADDLGVGDLGSYGQKKIKTPNLDRLAAEGIRFTSAYAGSAVGAPSRCTLMTGLHTGHAFIRANHGAAPLRPSDQTVAELLQGAGYTNAMIGKWDLGGGTGAPNQQGFDQFFGYLDRAHAQEQFPRYLWRNERWHLFDGNAQGHRTDYSTDWFFRAATNFVRDAYPGPFFIYLALTVPHANTNLAAQTGNGFDVPTDAPYSAEPWPQPAKNRAAMITRMDSLLGNLLARLEQLKLDQNTVIFFSSDNGPGAGGGVDPAFFNSTGGLRGQKGELYEGGLRVPFLVRWPGQIKPGQVSDFPVALWDFLPTACELAGVKTPPGVDGISILPTLRGEPQATREFLYWELHEGGRFQQAVRMGDWKAVRPGAGQKLELFHVAQDPTEKENVAGHHPNVEEKIEAILSRARHETPHWPVSTDSGR